MQSQKHLMGAIYNNSDGGHVYISTKLINKFNLDVCKFSVHKLIKLPIRLCVMNVSRTMTDKTLLEAF